MLKLNSQGFAHWFLPLLMIAIIGVVGAYVLNQSHADATPQFGHIYRFWNGVNHFYTANDGEAHWIETHTNWGKPFVYSNDYDLGTDNLIPVYRLQYQASPTQVAFYYTTSASGRDFLVKSDKHWTYKWIAWYVYDSKAPQPAAGYCRKPWYEFSKASTPVDYFFTWNKAEADGATAYTLVRDPAFNVDYPCNTNTSAGGVSAGGSSPGGTIGVTTPVATSPPPAPVQPITSTGTASAPQPSVGNTLTMGNSLPAGTEIVATNQDYRVTMQGDGNLVEYQGGKAVWATNTSGRGNSTFYFQGDGNLVVRNVSGQATWAANSQGKGAVRLVIEDNGNLDLFNSGNGLVWGGPRINYAP